MGSARDPMLDDATTGVLVDRMREEDVTAVVAIDASSPGSSAWDEAQLRGELSRSWAHLWVARSGRDSERQAGEPHMGPHASVVGFVATWLVADELHVLNVATAENHRRRGHARALMKTALAFAVEHRVRLVLLEVRRTNAAAIALYRGFGFVAMGVRERYYGDGEDAVEMLLRLDDRGRTVPAKDEVTLS